MKQTLLFTPVRRHGAVAGLLGVSKISESNRKKTIRGTACNIGPALAGIRRFQDSASHRDGDARRPKEVNAP